MSERKALAIRQNLTPSIWSMIQAVAPVMHRSRLFGVSSPEQAMAIMTKGFELGLPLTASFELVHVIGGKPSLSPRGALAVIMQSGELTGLKITEEPDSCTVWMKRSNGLEYQTTWTLEDAKRAGLVKKDGAWESYPNNLLRWRTLGFVEDVLFPDILAGMKRADEFGANITPEGDVIEGEWTAPPFTTEQATPATEQLVTLDDLVTRYGAEAVMQAAGGTIPGTQEEVAAVTVKLGQSNG